MSSKQEEMQTPI